ncbi:MAG: DNA-directed RNA polymerase subunit beta [Dehalococcoidia bacterium]|nr:DNA-directed RNA polymerase subunit beta [Dehalococcoidia bacterium]
MSVSSMSSSPVVRSFAKHPEVVEVPNLVMVQIDSFRWFQEEGIRRLFEEVSPIKDYTRNRLELHFVDFEFDEPKHSVEECLARGMTFSAPLRVQVRLLIKETGEIKEEKLFFGDFPLMTDKGTFVISGAERVVVSQLTRFPGVYFTRARDPISGRQLGFAKLVAERGAWLDFDTSSRNVISVRVSGKRKMTASTLLRAVGHSSDEELYALFSDVDTVMDHQYMASTIGRDSLIHNQADALVDIYRKLSSGEPPSLNSAKTLLNNFLFNPRRYSLGEVGRYKLNKKLGVEVPTEYLGLTPDDLTQIVRHIILLNNGKETPDDIDHLGNRRAQGVGFLLQNQFRVGIIRLERAVKERMSILGSEAATPSALINIRPVTAAIKEFFGRSQLSQFMDQTNPLAELTHKRRLSAMGPGGLSRERAGFEVRDVHHSHYGRICPIETPEGPNIGLIGSLATYASINKYGFVETPYRKVVHELANDSQSLVGRSPRENIVSEDGTVIAKAGVRMTEGVARVVAGLPAQNIKIASYVAPDVINLTADEEEQYSIAEANVKLNGRSEFIDERVDVKRGARYFRESNANVDLMDVSPKQIFSVSAALIPFLEHDDANRALMGSNMQRQGVPLLRPEAPLVSTGMEGEVARYSGQALFAASDGVVTSVTGSEIVILDEKSDLRSYPLDRFVRTNQGTCIDQRPIVRKGDAVKKGQILVDSSSIQGGQLALGRNVVCAFMSWRGYNYEDAIIISERIVKDDVYTSIHIEKYETQERNTKLGPEEITRDIPNVSEDSLGNLDEDGIVRIGAELKAGDILVGKITPKGETEPSTEEKLLRAIFGEKVRDVKDSSLRLPPGARGRVLSMRIFSRENHDELPAGVNRLVRVWIVQRRKLSIGDKMSGRHGNKGVVSIVLPEEDMPFLPDGSPVDIVLNPHGVPSRMNIGQVLESHLGWAGRVFGYRAITPIFGGANTAEIEDELCRVWMAWRAEAVNINPKIAMAADLEKLGAWLSEKGFDPLEIMDTKRVGLAKQAALCLWLEDFGINGRGRHEDELAKLVQKTYEDKRQLPPTFGKMLVRDGKTGETFDQPITIGGVYMMKLIHLVEDKVHARSTGPYSLITQQPLGGKAQFGGQRFGEMEVWALEGYGAAHTLQEMLTVKSDDIVGRARAYESIIKNEDVQSPSIPEACKVLFMELRALGFSVELLNEEEEKISITGEMKPRLKVKL